MNSRLAAASLTVLLLACGGGEPNPELQKQPKPASSRKALAAPAWHLPPNLLDMGSGASVVSRTAELSLEVSAALAIDSHKRTIWSTPARNPVQTLVVSLPTRTRITAVGATTVAAKWAAPESLTFESSADGITFAPLKEFALRPVWTHQIVTVTPVEARYVRVTTNGRGKYSQLSNLHVLGQELEPPRPASLEGCWRINEVPAVFYRHGARIFGRIGDENPVFLDGGTDGRTFRFAWAQNPDHGMALFTTAPDGKHLSALRWYAKGTPKHLGNAWFGERVDCGGTPLKIGGAEVVLTFLRRRSYYPLYTIQFDDQDRLLEDESDEMLRLIAYIVAGSKTRRFQLVAHEFRHDPETNRVRARARLVALRAALERRKADLSRIDLVAAGSDNPRVRPKVGTTHALYNVVELQLAQ